MGLSVALPYIIIWCIALVGYLRLRFYADSIKGGKDGAAFQVIAKGLLWLALWLPISAVSSALATEIYTRHPGSTAALVIANNYLNLAVLCVGFILVDKGTRKLVTITRSGSVAPSQRLIVGCLT